MIHYRSMREADKPLIYDSFKHSTFEDYKQRLNTQAELAPDGLTNIIASFKRDRKAEVEELMRKSSVVMMCDPEDDNFIFGYAIYKQIDDALILHWVYFKTPFQRCGLLRKLIREHFKVPQDQPIIATYKSPWPRVKMIMRNYRMVFKPQYRMV